MKNPVCPTCERFMLAGVVPFEPAWFCSNHPEALPVRVKDCEHCNGKGWVPVPGEGEHLDENVRVSLARREWMVVVAAARDYDRRVPREQGDGAACLDVIQAAIDA